MKGLTSNEIREWLCKVNFKEQDRKLLWPFSSEIWGSHRSEHVVVMPYGLSGRYYRFGEKYCFHLQPWITLIPFKWLYYYLLTEIEESHKNHVQSSQCTSPQNHNIHFLVNYLWWQCRAEHCDLMTYKIILVPPKYRSYILPFELACLISILLWNAMSM